MRILYDHQIFTLQKYGGISRYFFELIKRFNGVEDSCEVATLFTDNAYYTKEFNSNLNKFLPDVQFKGKERVIKIFNKKKSISDIQKGNFNIFHPTYYDDYFIDKIKSKPFVVTFHDVIHEKFSNQFESLRADTKIYKKKKRLLEHSSKIISVSETTKKDIVDFFDIDASKIDVIYLGNSLHNFSSSDIALIEADYVLFVGIRGEYKNFDFFITAIAQLLIDADLKLVCAGGGYFSPQEVILIQSLKLEKHIMFKKIVDDNVLANYYAHALFFCFPSLYEGFGIPVLESFACGCPGLFSNGGSLPEVGGDAALYFDPTNPDSLRKSMDELINDQLLRQSLRERGFERLKQFSWDTTFSETIEVYKSLM